MSKKGILVVSFGTSYAETRRKTIDRIEEDLRTEFSERAFYHAFSSRFIVKKLQKNGENIKHVEDVMEEILADGITDLLIQPTHLMRAQEYDRLIKLFDSRREYFECMQIGRPLMAEAADLEKMAEIIPQIYPETQEENTCLVLMGHGTDHEQNQIYRQLSEILKEKKISALVGTVESTPNLDDILEALKQRNDVSNIVIAPLLVVAGDHATNDMASDDEDSWKSRISAAGYKVECILKGLGEYPEIRKQYIEHAKDALNS